MTAPLRTLAEIRRESAAQERLAVEAALEHCGWRLSPAARLLELHDTQLRRLIDQLGLRDEYARRNPGPGSPPKSERQP